MAMSCKKDYVPKASESGDEEELFTAEEEKKLLLPTRLTMEEGAKPDPSGENENRSWVIDRRRETDAEFLDTTTASFDESDRGEAPAVPSDGNREEDEKKLQTPGESSGDQINFSYSSNDEGSFMADIHIPDFPSSSGCSQSLDDDSRLCQFLNDQVQESTMATPPDSEGKKRKLSPKGQLDLEDNENDDDDYDDDEQEPEDGVSTKKNKSVSVKVPSDALASIEDDTRPTNENQLSTPSPIKHLVVSNRKRKPNWSMNEKIKVLKAVLVKMNDPTMERNRHSEDDIKNNVVPHLHPILTRSVQSRNADDIIEKYYRSGHPENNSLSRGGMHRFLKEETLKLGETFNADTVRKYSDTFVKKYEDCYKI